jgi:putative hemolysin
MVIATSAVAVLLVLSALLTAADAAGSQISASHVRTLQDEGFAGAEALAAMRDDHDGVRASVRLLTMILDLVSISVIVTTGVSRPGAVGPVVGTALGVLIVLLGADLIPRAVAGRRPVRLALSSAPLLVGVVRLMRPLLTRVTRLEDRLGGDGEPRTNELREIQEIGEEEGVLEASEKLLVERAFRLDELTAWDVMVPRVDIFSWQEARTLDDIIEELSEVPYSRVPVYNESVDDVTGIVYVREVYERFAKGDREVTLAEIAREPFFVPGSLSLTQLLHDFQARRIHLGIVADEFGGTDGLVTLEDILEELVGEIHDETDVAEEEIVRISDDVVECDAGVDVRDLDDALGVTLPKVEHRSLNGLILEELGQVPAKGESLERAGVRIDILDSSDTQVLRARLTKLVSEEAG